jgi:hypothetical protein
LDTLSQVLFHISHKSKQIIICEDFNVNFLSDNADRISLSDLLASFGLHSMIAEPTGITNTSSSCLDNIVTNIAEDFASANVLDLGFSDHTAQLFRNTYKDPATECFYISKRFFSQSQIDKFLSDAKLCGRISLKRKQ